MSSVKVTIFTFESAILPQTTIVNMVVIKDRTFVISGG